MAELQSTYSGVTGSHRTYVGTGYFNPSGSPKNRYIISKYNELKAIEEAKAAQALAELNKYHYTNIYKHIAETGLRPDGTPASDVEKAIAPYVPLIEPIQMVTAAYAGKQVAKYDAYLASETTSGAIKIEPRVTLEDITPGEIGSLTIDVVEEMLPDGWDMYKHDPRYHIYDQPKVKGQKIPQRIRFDPPDPNTPYDHVHVTDKDYNLLDKYGNIVDRADPAGHIESNYRKGN